MSTVQAEYLARVAAMSIAERVLRADAMFRWARDYVARQIDDGPAPVSKAELKWEVAIRLYGADPAVRKLIEELQARAGR